MGSLFTTQLDSSSGVGRRRHFGVASVHYLFGSEGYCLALDLGCPRRLTKSGCAKLVVLHMVSLGWGGVGCHGRFRRHKDVLHLQGQSTGELRYDDHLLGLTATPGARTCT